MRDTLDNFLTHEEFEEHRKRYADLYGPNGWLLFIACDSGTDLARDVRNEYHSALEQKSAKKPSEKWLSLQLGVPFPGSLLKAQTKPVPC